MGLSTSASERRYVVLGGGLAVPLPPVLLLLELEARGLTVTRDGGDLIVRPRGHLSEADRVEITRWKNHLLALVSYAAPECG